MELLLHPARGVGEAGAGEGGQVDDLEATVARLEALGHQPRPIKRDGALSYAMEEGPDGVLVEVFRFDESTPADLKPYFDIE